MQKQKEKSGGKEQAPVIVKKIKKRYGDHHGGAWKVAYADFVTSMMALFLLLWILASTDSKTKAALAQYFRDPGVFETSTSGGGNNPVAQYFGEAGILDSKQGILPETSLQGLQEKIEEELSHLKEYPAIKDQISIQVVAEGLLIELIDKEGVKDKPAFFDLSSAELKPALLHVLEKIVQQVSGLPNKIAIGGHTDARPFRSSNAFYSNWELSAARALNARRATEEMGLPAGQIERVVGYADSAPLVPNDPFNPANRRISILILHPTPASPAPAPVIPSSPVAYQDSTHQ
ncbi:MAG: OmpA family protein [Deltaproteobacteria bacterium]|nr:OmpA family protein [Deltaproteobacteria bacterium]